MNKWPQQFLNVRAQEFLENEKPTLMARLIKLEQELQRLDKEKQSKRGRKPAK